MPRPKISVIVPAYNEAKSIGLCLTSLKNQDCRQPYEIIVVDNNSTDSTPAIAKRFKTKLISETQVGPGPARNAGAKAARGQILAFIDADSIAPPDWLNNINKAFASQSDLAALVGPYRFHPKSKYRLIPFLLFPLGEMINKMITGYFSFGGANFAIKKKVFTAVGGFNTKFVSFEDMELARRVSRIGKIGYLHELQVKTSDRRLRYGINHYLKYGLPIFLSFALLNKPSKKSFPNIRS